MGPCVAQQQQRPFMDMDHYCPHTVTVTALSGSQLLHRASVKFSFPAHFWHQTGQLQSERGKSYRNGAFNVLLGTIYTG